MAFIRNTRLGLLRAGLIAATVTLGSIAFLGSSAAQKSSLEKPYAALATSAEQGAPSAVNQPHVAPDAPLDQPGITEQQVIAWTRAAVSEALKFDAEHLASASNKNFTKEGWEEFKKSDRVGINPPMADRVKEATPALIGARVFKDAYQWNIQFTWSIPKTELLHGKTATGVFATTEAVFVTVRRAPKETSPDGLAIVKFYSVKGATPPSHVLPPLSSSNQACPRLPGTPSSPIFHDLKRINFYLQIPARFQNALDCLDQRRNCEGASSEEDYIYPKPLRPENLTKLFVKKIETHFSPFVQRDEQCRIPEVVILNRQDLLKAVYQKNTITFTVKLTFDDLDEPSNRPRIAVLTVHRFRPDCGHSNYDTQVGLSSAMPFALDMGEQEIVRRLDYFIRHSHLGHVGIEQESVY